ncbi:response regulator [Sediminitomix flava]|uniref:histidine kinase n=1 Tax=Sediminitomix flava TaxID=379075 RepID=A0A315ZHF8_SEDFL|nr:response regulator [Sediminitomix flava]PWJ44629.1 signal transduction histidine kinase [Sediminitomix flava]
MTFYWLEYLIDIGTGNGNTKDDDKKVRYLNIYTYAWQVVVIISSIFNYILNMWRWDEQIILFAGFIFCAISQILQAFRMYSLARGLIILMSFAHGYLYPNVILPSTLMEYYLIFPLILILVLYEDKWVYYVTLTVATITFTLPNYFFLHYPIETFNQVSNPIFFIVLFLAFLFFKNQNTKNERLLEKQKNEALQQKVIIENQKKELEELNRFQTKFFVNISHELRTPLTLIDGYIHQISTPLDEVQLISKQTQKMTHIVNDMLDISKTKFNKLELRLIDVDFCELIYKVYSSFLPAFEQKGISLTLHSSLKKAYIKADYLYLERAFNNIIHNGLKFTNTGGSLEINIHDFQNELFIKIIDNGIGINEVDLQHIFKRFYQGTNDINTAEGSGIGLSFTKDIIELHHGKISIESKEGNGTQIFVNLPLLESQEGTITSNELPNSQISDHIHQTAQNAKRILLVEDHDEMRQYLKTLLKDFQIFEASDGEDALKVLSQKEIDYIITDYMMPKMDGHKLVRKIKALNIDIPILILTARIDLEGKLNLLRLGVDDYLHKPFSKEELLIRINRALKNYDIRKSFNTKEDIPTEKTEIVNPFLEQLKLFIKDHCAISNFGLQDICDELALSQSSLYRKVKSLTGLSPNEFVRDVKLEKAKTLVDQKVYSTHKELSYAVGFSKTAYFIQLYQQRYGRKPFDK